ncbi:MAG TPA: hypothetical protein VEX43_08105 [Chthoniobacterales bacterium]|nr:hypothetical protein [Chthoniobacterales bacterium]
MTAAVRFIALFLLFTAMNLLWQFPIVPLPLIGEPQPLIVLCVVLQPWLLPAARLVESLPDSIGETMIRAVWSPNLHGASIPLAVIISLASVVFYYGCYRLILHAPVLRRLRRTPSVVPVVIYFLLFSVYSASCVYVVLTLTRRLNAL